MNETWKQAIEEAYAAILEQIKVIRTSTNSGERQEARENLAILIKVIE